MRRKKKDNLHQDDEILDRKLKLWVPCKLKSKIRKSEHDTMIAGHIGQNNLKDLILGSLW
jgi:hypothetical protein